MVSFRLSHSKNTYDVASIERSYYNAMPDLYEIDKLEKRLDTSQLMFIVMTTLTIKLYVILHGRHIFYKLSHLSNCSVFILPTNSSRFSLDSFFKSIISSSVFNLSKLKRTIAKIDSIGSSVFISSSSNNV